MQFQCLLKHLVCLLCSVCCITSISLFAANEDNEQQLNTLKQAISSERAKISKTSKAYQKLEAQLQQDEIAIAKIAKALNQTQQELSLTKQQISDLEKQKTQLEQQKRQQEALLAKQLRSAYTSGNHDYLKLLLNQEQPSKIQRVTTYYQYLNSARITEIENFKTTISQLLEVVTKLQEKSTKLDQLYAQQKIQQTNLTQSSAQRAETVKALQKQLTDSKQILAKLEADEENLLIEIQRLAELAKKSKTLNGLDNLYKKLKWPVRGKISHSFGSKKQGYLKWKGVLLSAETGKTVNSISHGKVLFSNWLKGYGLVTVVDHGQGYMSLYGHNQALLKSVGDTVDAGEPIALVGQSGGQNQSGLYFEIRYQGQAVNPAKWCR